VGHDATFRVRGTGHELTCDVRCFTLLPASDLAWGTRLFQIGKHAAAKRDVKIDFAGLGPASSAFSIAVSGHDLISASLRLVPPNLTRNDGGCAADSVSNCSDSLAGEDANADLYTVVDGEDTSSQRVSFEETSVA
jgi:hypothetical protein